MTAACRHRTAATRRTWPWLLALVLWLPVAQWAAATHTLLHLHGSLTEQPDPAGNLPDACETCVVAATLGSAAPGPLAPSLVPPQPPAARLQPASTPWAAAPAPAPFRSRAPPSLHA